MSKMIQHMESSSKGVAREMAASWQPLSILMEQLRSSLGAGKKQARVWLGLSQSEASGLPVRSKRTPSPKQADSQSEASGLRALRYAACVMMVMMGVNLWGQTEITSLSQITAADGNYVITQDITGGTPGVSSFSGTLEAAINSETHMPYRIKNLSAPLFTTLTGTVKNLVFENVNITTGTDVGAVASYVQGTSSNIACIYNCGILSGSVSGSGNVGGLVGVLGQEGNTTATNDNCYARVINCYSFADIEGGTTKGGIVGKNCFASTSSNIRTMVMNCMFYGTGSGIYPIYGGEEISNKDASKLNNYNYYCYENLPTANIATKVVNNKTVTQFNCALSAEERFLNRFEFYRLLLNSTRELAAYYVDPNPETITVSETAHKRYHKDLMAKWVLDKSIAPYPILKEQGYYSSIINNYESKVSNNKSVINYVKSVAPETPEATKTLSVTLSGTGITTTSLSLPITDKDPANFNYCYHKVQLPYFNDVGTGNYTKWSDNKSHVVTGWEVSFNNGTQGAFYSDSYDVTMSSDGKSIIKTPYNYADRSTYAKDLKENQIYAQGAYLNVPDGVSSITITPHWATAVYLSDANYDSYNYNGAGVTDFGTRYVNGKTYDINGSSQIVYTSMSNALNALPNASSVYDNAVVLVGNYHKGDENELSSSSSKPYTIMSIDLDKDSEPDYSLIFRSGKQKQVYSIRYDFINIPGMAMAHKTASNTNMGIPGNCKIFRWFEITNTALIRFNQFEYDNNGKASGYPLILLGGVIEQFVSTNYANNDQPDINHTTNIYLGGNVWFKLFSNGVHADKEYHKTAHRPISVTGGEYETFYLSGYFQPNSPYYTDNAECYIDGGKFGEVAGAGQEKIDGSVTWVINHADIREFYGGGINPSKPISGNIFVDIKNSNVTKYCGGPKFGNMADNMTVTTNATGGTFGTFYGAGNGGTALVRQRTYNQSGAVNYDWNSDNNGNTVKTYKSGSNKRGTYNSTKGGISISYEYEHFEGSSTNTVGRFYVNYASLSTAQTNNVFSTLTGCTITGNFYGGGSLGKVSGNATSILENCTVNGSVFGAGYSATAPTADVFPAEGFTNHVATPEELNRPRYNSTTGMFEKGTYPDPVEYTWSNTYGGNTSSTSLVENNEGNWIHTNVPISGLGTVEGNVILTLKGSTTVSGSVYGGGDESAVKVKEGVADSGNITVTLAGNTAVTGNVYGGGNEGEVEGSTTVNIEQ